MGLILWYVLTKISTPSSTLFCYSFIVRPMPIPSIFNLQWWEICLPTFLHCKTSSLLAVIMMALGLCEAVNVPTPSSYFFSWEAMGRRYDNVFPEPVGDEMWWQVDCFLKREASSAYWMYVGVWILLAYRYLNIEGCKGKWSKAGRRSVACLVENKRTPKGFLATLLIIMNRLSCHN